MMFFDRRPHHFGGFGLTAPQVSSRARTAGDHAIEDRPVLQPRWLLRYPAVDNREIAEDLLNSRGDRREPEIRVVGKQPDRVRGREGAQRRASTGIQYPTTATRGPGDETPDSPLCSHGKVRVASNRNRPNRTKYVTV